MVLFVIFIIERTLAALFEPSYPTTSSAPTLSECSPHIVVNFIQYAGVTREVEYVGSAAAWETGVNMAMT